MTVTATIKKTTHGEHTGGYCASSNNCFYKGSSTVWQVWVDCFDFPAAGVASKWAAQGFADWVNAQGFADEKAYDASGGFDGFACDNTEASAKVRERNVQEV